MLYDLANPSDAVTFKAETFDAALCATILVGNGNYSATPVGDRGQGLEDEPGGAHVLHGDRLRRLLQEPRGGLLGGGEAEPRGHDQGAPILLYGAPPRSGGCTTWR